MARRKATSQYRTGVRKKTRQGCSCLTKHGNRGGGAGGSTTSKQYKKKYRGQGR